MNIEVEPEAWLLFCGAAFFLGIAVGVVLMGINQSLEPSAHELEIVELEEKLDLQRQVNAYNLGVQEGRMSAFTQVNQFCNHTVFYRTFEVSHGN